MAEIVRLTVHAADDWDAAFNVFCNAIIANNYSPKTLKYYRSLLTPYFEFAMLNNITPQNAKKDDIREYLSIRLKKSAEAGHHAYRSLKTFFDFLEIDGVIDNSPVKGIQPPRQAQKILTTFSSTDLEKMIQAQDVKTFPGIRNMALLLTLADTGCRNNELCGLKTTNVNWHEGTLLVTGKGSKERLVSFGINCQLILSQYLSRRGELTHEYCFVSITGAPFTVHTLGHLVEKIGQSIGIKLTPHQFRRYFATTFLREGGGVFDCQLLLGHNDIQMTRKYALLSNADAIRSHKKHSPGDMLSIQVTRRTRLK